MEDQQRYGLCMETLQHARLHLQVTNSRLAVTQLHISKPYASQPGRRGLFLQGPWLPSELCSFTTVTYKAVKRVQAQARGAQGQQATATHILAVLTGSTV